MNERFSKRPIIEECSTPSAVNSIKPPQKTMNKLFLVRLTGNGGGFVQKHVFARTEREALLAVIEGIPQESIMWNEPGWRDVSVYEESKPVLL
jgi:hypothetical protein